jgi:hypothetical protein
MMMAEMFGATFAMLFLMPYMMAFSLLPIIIYIVARWRQAKEGHADPQLGLKVALAFFRVLAFQICLGGVWLLVYGIVAKGDSGEIFRVAGGLLIPGLIVFAAHHIAMQRTNDAVLPMPARMFDGLNLIQTGIIGFLALLAAFVVALQKDSPGDSEALRLTWSLVAVYTVTWGVLAYRFIENTAPPPPAQPAVVQPPQQQAYPPQ